MVNFDLNKLIWTKNDFDAFDEFLQSLSEEEFCRFSSRIVRTPSTMLGIRIPKLREITAGIAKGNIISFLDGVTIDNFEKSLVSGLLVTKIKDQETALRYFDKFLPYVDNWATCDVCCGDFKLIGKNCAAHWDYVRKLVLSGNEFTSRCGIILLMKFFRKQEFIDKVFLLMDAVNSSAYYVNMAQAWLVAEYYIVDALKTTEYIKNNKLNDFTHNKAIQKIRESFRVTSEEKSALQLFKRKHDCKNKIIATNN